MGDALGPPDGVVGPALHELRNAMFGVSSLLQLLAEEDAIVADDDLAQLCRRALQESGRASALIVDLSTLVGPAQPRLAQVQCDGLVQSVLTQDAGGLPPLADGRSMAPTVCLDGAPAGAVAWCIETDRALLRGAVFGVVRLCWRSIRAASGDPAVAVRLHAEPDGALVITVGGAGEPSLPPLPLLPWTPAPTHDADDARDGRALIEAAVQRRLATLHATLSVRVGAAGVQAWRITLSRRR